MGRPMALVALVTFAVGVLALDARATYGARTTADEPQYLLTAISIAEDLDLDISDELDARRYEPFHEITLDPQTVALDADGQRLSPHDPLLPALLALPVRWGGWVAAKVVLAAIAAVTAAATLWLAVRRFAVPAGTGAWVIGGFFAAPPLSAYATQVYPEMAAALCVVAATIVASGRLQRRHTVVVAAAVIALPWLSVKYVPVAATLAIGFWLRARRSEHRAQAVVLATAVVVAAVIYLIVHQRVYGGWTVYAAGDHFVGGEFGVVGRDPDYVGRTRRLVGLLVDREFGLIAWNPAYLLLVPATVALIRSRRRRWGLLVAPVLAGWATATWVALTMHGWWWPSRQIVAVLPLAVVAIAIAAASSRWLYRLTVAGCVVGIVNWLWIVAEASSGRRTLVVDFAETASPFHRAVASLLPDHQNMTAASALLTWLWVLTLAALATFAWRRTEAGRGG